MRSSRSAPNRLPGIEIFTSRFLYALFDSSLTNVPLAVLRWHVNTPLCAIILLLMILDRKMRVFPRAYGLSSVGNAMKSSGEDFRSQSTPSLGACPSCRSWVSFEHKTIALQEHCMSSQGDAWEGHDAEPGRACPMHL